MLAGRPGGRRIQALRSLSGDWEGKDQGGTAVHTSFRVVADGTTTPAAGKVQQLVFEFQGAGNLPDSDIGHQHKLAIEFADATHITERWT